VEAGISSQLLYTSAKGPIYKTGDETRNRESRYIPVDKFPIYGDMTIVGNRVGMITLSGTRPIGVVIESEELASTLKSMFELAWGSAEAYNPVHQK
jgi:hypothetical protein